MRVTEQDDPAQLGTDIDGYSMVNLHARYTGHVADGRAEVRFFARGANLTDDTARRHTSFVKDFAALPGASGLLGSRAQF